MKSDIRRRRIVSLIESGFGGWSGGGVTPFSFSGLQWYYDVSQLTGLVNDDLVTTVTDLSGNGHHLQQTSGGNKGSYKTNILNGQPALLSAAGIYYNPVNGNSDIDFLHTGPSTVIWLVQTSDINDLMHLFDSAKATTTNRGRTIRFTVVGGGGFEAFFDAIFNGTGTEVAGGTSVNGAAPSGVPILIVSRYENALAGADDFSVDISGVNQIFEETSSAPSASGASLTARFFCDTDIANHFKGYFFWSVAYNRRLTDTELNSLLGGSVYGI